MKRALAELADFFTWRVGMDCQCMDAARCEFFCEDRVDLAVPVDAAQAFESV